MQRRGLDLSDPSMEEAAVALQQHEQGTSSARAAAEGDHATCWVGSTSSLKTTTLLDLSNSNDPPQALLQTLLAATEAKSLVVSIQQVPGLASQLQAYWHPPPATTPARTAARSKQAARGKQTPKTAIGRSPSNGMPYQHVTGMPQAPGSSSSNPAWAMPGGSSSIRCQASSKPSLSAVTVMGCSSFDQAAAVARLLDVLPSPQHLQRLELCDSTHLGAQQALGNPGDNFKQHHHCQQQQHPQQQQQQQYEIKLEAVKRELEMPCKQEPPAKKPQPGPSRLHLTPPRHSAPTMPAAAAGPSGVRSPQLGAMWDFSHLRPPPGPFVEGALKMNWSKPVNLPGAYGSPAGCRRLPISSLAVGAAPTPSRPLHRRNSTPAAARCTPPPREVAVAAAAAAAQAAVMGRSKPWGRRGLQILVRFDTRNLGPDTYELDPITGEKVIVDGEPVLIIQAPVHRHPWDLHQQHQLAQLWPLLGGAAAGLQELTLEGACLGQLPVLCGLPYPALTSLVLRHCCPGSSTALPTALGSFTELHSLEAASCQLREVPEELGVLTQLRRLCLSDNYLQHLPPAVLELTHLQHLDLRDNCLQALPEGIVCLQDLEELLLGVGRWTAPPVPSQEEEGGLLPGAGPQQGTGVSDKGASVPALSSNIWELSNLKRLDLRGGKLGVVPNYILHLHELEELDIRSNSLKALPPRFDQLRKLQKLDASYNQLASLPEQCSVMVNLRHLELSGNKFDLLPEAVNTMVRLTYLSLGNNTISCLPKGLGKDLQGPLKVLHLCTNQLKALPESLGHLSHLEQLHLGFNSIACLPDSLTQLCNLRGLYAQANQLRDLPAGFGALSALEELELGRNYICQLPAELAPLTGLRVCSLVGGKVASS